jgi:hypoxanthine-DNA glycosylase
MLKALPPLVSVDTRLLILGSFPGVASLRAQQYYGHPQNHFWRILQAVWPSTALNTGASSYQIRSEWLLSKKLGVWDVYASCEREGSLDSSIRQAVLNDFSGLTRLCPHLAAIAHNGGESFKHAQQVLASLQGAGVRREGPPLASTAPSGLETAAPNLLEQVCTGARSDASGERRPARCSVLHEVKSVGVYFYRLPSTSPANATWSFERKLAAWREVFEKHGLI